MEASPGIDPRLRDHLDCRTLTRLVYDSLPADRAVGRVQSFAKGSFLWSADTSKHDVFFLKRGQVAILLSDPAGCEVILRVVKPGELLGELCFCLQRNQPRENCAQAIIDSEVFRIEFTDFLSYLRRNQTTMEAFTFTLCERLSDAENRIEVLSKRGAEARLGRLLLQLAGSWGGQSARRPGEITLAVSHDELARMAAMTRPHVSVTMSKLRKLGLVHYSRGSQLTVQGQRLVEYLAQENAGAEE